ncbi:glycosyltransferase family 2 protein [Algoriphagus sp. CAU 1675]|uniref:glycosyltransferase family 2 protein n=1 Tax=Algoriphagus sp. CAU 1675 TaxID=3032597 RepID=UPI0023DBE3AA|nr:glycosyltransferase family 2 protein [Algoriphagus sp. CAU 1675]MDF2159405.1 glycosyltransferase family 2 protein [Algoriphagus sp. CAU 1675]
MISVIIPFFNSEKTLARAINSVLKNDFVSEILLINDGSSDESINIAMDFVNSYLNINLYHHPGMKNKGACASRNLGIMYSSCDWIQFLDSDDELLPFKLASQVPLINDDFCFIVGNSIFVDLKNRQKKIFYFKDPWVGLIKSRLGNTVANLWNKKFLLKVGGWDESLFSSQEYDLMFRLLKINSNIGYCMEFSSIIYKQVNSISTSIELKNIRIFNWIKLRNNIKTHLISINQFNFLRRYYFYSYIYKFHNINQLPYLNHNGIYYWWFYSFILFLKKNLFLILNSIVIKNK